jgi:hypothetical protein
MSTNKNPETRATQIDTDIDAVIERLRVLPEPESLEFYSQLSPKLQWLARQRTTGQRRQALIAYHAITLSRCRC